MKNTYHSLTHYHEQDRTLLVERMDMPHFTLTRLNEHSGDVTFANIERSFLSMDLSGTRRHITRMDGILSERPTEPGDVAIVPKGMSLRFAWDTISARQICLVLQFDPGLFDTYAPEVKLEKFDDGHLIPTDYGPSPRIATLLHLLAGELDPETIRGRIFAEQAVRLLALELAATSWTRPGNISLGKTGQDGRILRAIGFIKSQFRRDISLLEIARESGLSPSYLVQLFQRHTGQTPYDFVIARRVEYASALLRETRTPIAEVAVCAGFSDQQHMTRMFKARLGLTPNAVRKAS
jgi:AraC-like DNA-binding protein